MEMALQGLGMLCSLVGLVCSIIVLVHAFKESVGQGLLCLCVPCYVLYYAFAKFEHEKKGLVLAGLLGGNVVGNALVGAAQGMRQGHR
jgi:translocator protein